MYDFTIEEFIKINSPKEAYMKKKCITKTTTTPNPGEKPTLFQKSSVNSVTLAKNQDEEVNPLAQITKGSKQSFGQKVTQSNNENFEYVKEKTENVQRNKIITKSNDIEASGLQKQEGKRYLNSSAVSKYTMEKVISNVRNINTGKKKGFNYAKAYELMKKKLDELQKVEPSDGQIKKPGEEEKTVHYVQTTEEFQFKNKARCPSAETPRDKQAVDGGGEESESALRSYSHFPFEKLKMKLDEDIKNFLESNRFSATLTDKKRLGKSGTDYKKNTDKPTTTNLIPVTEKESELNINEEETEENCSDSKAKTNSNSPFIIKIKAKPINTDKEKRAKPGRVTEKGVEQNKKTSSQAYAAKNAVGRAERKTEKGAQLSSIKNLLNQNNTPSDLTPIPLRKSREEGFHPGEYINAERAAVLVRRIEYSYNVKMKRMPNPKETEAKILLIQKWWRSCLVRLKVKNSMATIIQQVFRGSLSRKAFWIAMRQMKVIFPFLSTVIFVVERRLIKNYFNILCSRRNILEERLKIIQRTYKAYRKWYILIKSTILIQAIFRGWSFRNNKDKALYLAREVHPLLYYFLTYKFKKGYLVKKEIFFSIVVQMNLLLLRIKFGKLVTLMTRYMRSYFLKDGFKFFLTRLKINAMKKKRIEMISKKLKELFPIYYNSLKWKCFYQWKRKYWQTRNYCRLGMSLFGKILKFSYWRLFKLGLHRVIQIKSRLKILLKKKESRLKRRALRKLISLVKRIVLRGTKLCKLVLKKHQLTKRIALGKLHDKIYYKHKTFSLANNLSRAGDLLKTACRKRISKEYQQRQSKSFKNLHHVFKYSQVFSRLKCFLNRAQMRAEHGKKLSFIRWKMKALAGKQHNILKLIKLANAIKLVSGKGKAMLKEKFTRYFFIAKLQSYADLMRKKQLESLSNANCASLQINDYLNKGFERKEFSLFKTGQRRRDAKMLMMIIRKTFHARLLDKKIKFFDRISLDKKIAKLLYVIKRRVNKKEILLMNSFRYWIQVWNNTTGKLKMEELALKEQIASRKTNLLNTFLMKLHEKKSKVFSCNFIQWRRAARQLIVIKSSDVIGNYTMNTLKAIKSRNINLERSKRKEELSKIITNKIRRCDAIPKYYFHQWKKQMQTAKLVISAGKIGKYCRKVLKKMNSRALANQIFHPFRIQNIKKQLITFSRKLISISHGNKFLHKFVNLKIKPEFLLIYKQFSEAILSRASRKQLQPIKLGNLFKCLADKSNFFLLKAFHVWRCAIFLNKITRSSSIIGAYCKKISRKIQLRKFYSKLQIRNLFKVALQVNKLGKFKKHIRENVIRNRLRESFGKIKYSKRMKYLGRIIYGLFSHQLFFLFKKWKEDNKKVRSGCAVIQGNFRTYRNAKKIKQVQKRNRYLNIIVNHALKKEYNTFNFFWTKFKHSTGVFLRKHPKMKKKSISDTKLTGANPKTVALSLIIHTIEDKDKPFLHDGFLKLANRFRWWKNQEKIKQLKSALMNVRKGMGALALFPSMEYYMRLYLTRWRRANTIFNLYNGVLKIQNKWRLHKLLWRIKQQKLKEMYEHWNAYLIKLERMVEIFDMIFDPVMHKWYKMLIMKLKNYPLKSEEKNNIIKVKFVDMIRKKIGKTVLNKILKFHRRITQKRKLSAQKITKSMSMYVNKKKIVNYLTRLVIIKEDKMKMILNKCFHKFRYVTMKLKYDLPANIIHTFIRRGIYKTKIRRFFKRKLKSFYLSGLVQFSKQIKLKKKK